jgi:GT2 family glycosyltransferase
MARPVFGACAGAAIYRQAALHAVGHFDEDFFALYEDVDWSLRAQLAGFSCRYVPTAVAYHMGGATLGRGLTDTNRYYMWRNALWIVVKSWPAMTLLRHGRELLRGQRRGLQEAKRERRLRILGRAWRDALLGMPRVLRKRRAVQRARRIASQTLDATVGAGDGATSL